MTNENQIRIESDVDSIFEELDWDFTLMKWEHYQI